MDGNKFISQISKIVEQAEDEQSLEDSIIKSEPNLKEIKILE